MKNYFVACGGTGAHVMLAMIRLHILGYPFGLFVGQGGKKFPDLFLVDQDDTNGVNGGKSTAWEEVKKLLGEHPGRFKPGDLFISNRLPRHEVVSPLPVGSDNRWYKSPNNHLGFRFSASSILELITSQHQRDIDYSIGMMASPAVGALLFRLKEQDIADPKAEYKNLLNDISLNPVVVCGSVVGGTGASVTPTLAQALHEKDAKVMAVLVHRWFEFSQVYKSPKKSEKAKRRNKEMVENAASGLAYSGEDLSNKVATVLVGGPDSKLVSREYTKDNEQPHKDSYIHVVAAIAGLRHLFSGVILKGLYGVSASEDSKLTGDIKFGETDTSTLDDLYGKAEILIYILNLYCDILDKYDTQSQKLVKVKSWVNFLNFGSRDFPKLKIVKWILDGLDGKAPKIHGVVEELEKIKKIYVDLLKWLRNLDIECQIERQNFFHLETNHIERIRENLQKKIDGLPPLVDQPRKFNDRNEILLKEEEYIALSLFHWVSDWISDSVGSDVFIDKGKSTQNESEVTGYWPPCKEEGTHPEWENMPGELGKVPDPKIDLCIKNHVKYTDVSSNGWPHPIAVVQHYKYQIAKKDPTAIRKLELLLVGHALRILELEDVERPDQRDGDLSIETLVGEFSSDLAKYKLVHHKNKKKYGFNSPATLLCPVPDISDEEWRDLWDEINGYAAPPDWGKSSKWIADAKKARSLITFWASYLLDNYQGGALLWAKFLKIDDSFMPFGIADWLSMSDGTSKIPLPINGYSKLPPKGCYSSIQSAKGKILFDSKNDEEEIRKYIPDLNEFGGFVRIKDSSFSGVPYRISMIWKEHLEELQKEKKIFAWGQKKDDNQTWIMLKTGEKFRMIQIDKLRVIDIDTIKISKCIPLRQRLVPGSQAEIKEGELKFPDLPILPEYIGLVEVPPNNQGAGGRLIDCDWEGIIPCSMDPKGDRVTWEVHFSGRPNPERIEIHIGDIDEIEAGAHWMIWPNFKAKKGQLPWRAYYVYEHSTRKDLEARVMILDDKGIPSEPEKRPPNTLGHSRALKFDAQSGRHSGMGIPLAFCAYDHGLKENVGLYIIRLKEYERDKLKWEVAVDFGTSHTVAAHRDDDKLGIPIELEPELGSKDKQLSWHASENWPGDDAEKKSEMELEMWRPTYLEDQQNSMLPSDLWSFEEVVSLQKSNIRQHWNPMTHYVIPQVQLNRSDSHKHVISGFKWEKMVQQTFSVSIRKSHMT